VIGGWEKKQKKFMPNAKKNKSCKEEGKKKFVQKEGPTLGPAI